MHEPFTGPFFRRLERLRIRTRRSTLGTREGSHLSLRRGQGLEFSDYRQYSPGDDFRHIDWNVYGRTDRVTVKQFRAEQNLEVTILLDSSASMGLPEGEKKFELARNIALSLGYVALADGDSVLFSCLGHHNTPRYSGQAAFFKAYDTLNKIVPAGTFSLKTEIRAAVAAQKLPARCYLISDFFMPHEEQTLALDFLRAKNFDISVIQVIAPSELRLEPSRIGVMVDVETGEEIEVILDSSSVKEYANSLGNHVETLERYCRKAGIQHLIVSSEETLTDVVLQKFPRAGLLQ